MEGIYELFCQYTAFGARRGEAPKEPELDSKNFTKLLKDTKVLTKKFTSNDSDIIIAKAKAASGRKSSRKLDFDEFIHCLELTAAQKSVDPEKIYAKLLASSTEPTLARTQPKSPSDVTARLTDTSQYTGAHKLRFDEEGNGKGLAGRDSAKKGGGHIPAFAVTGKRGTARAEGGGGGGGGGSAATLADDLSAVDLDPITLQEAFTQYALFGASRVQTTVELSTSAYTKLLREAKVITKKFTSNDTDIIFTKAKTKGGRKHTKKMNFDEFQLSLDLIAEQKGIDVAKVEAKICQQVAGGAQSSGTKASAAAVTDRLTNTAGYTGAHKARFDQNGQGMGAAGRVQYTGVQDLSTLTNRQEADVRGRLR